jgi:hypothetical protein
MRPPGAPLHREKARRRQRVVGVAQAVCQQDHDMAIELRVGAAEVVEHGAADETQLRIAQCADRGGARRPVDHGQLAHDRAGTENRENALAAGGRDDIGLEQAVLDPIAAVALVAGEKQHLTRRQRHGARFREQTARQLRRECGEQVIRLQGFFHLHAPSLNQPKVRCGTMV